MGIIYLMGAGRSGTTMLATLLGESNRVVTLGEMHQFLDHVIEQKLCSCGDVLQNCVVWSGVLKDLEELYSFEELKEINELNEKLEFHSNFLWALNKTPLRYAEFQKTLNALIKKRITGDFYLDSSKYVSRALLLQRIWKRDFKVIYVVRDLRGVINSFSKQVQSPKSPISTIIYYGLINVMAEIACFFLGKQNVLKIRYEDYVKNYEQSLTEIGSFLSINLNSVVEKVKHEEAFVVPHIIGGNRLKKEKRLKLKFDNEWLNRTPSILRYSSYFLAFPFMLINKYKP